MIHILKQSEEWVTALKQNEFQYATLKLTFFYVLSTAVILLVSSIAILLFFKPPETDFLHAPITTDVEESHSELSLYELREHLVVVIFLVDVAILAIVSLLAYFFAQLTLRPIKVAHDQQKAFMSNVAHELRTPLAVMRSGAETILRREQTSELYQEFVTDVKEESQRLARLTDQLLQLLRVGAVGSSFVETQLISPLVESQINYFKPYAEEHGVSLTSDIAPTVSLPISTDSLTQVVQNLLKNAVDYNHPGGLVTVSLSDSDSQVVLKVADTGVGIAPEKQQQVFKRFVKIDAARQPHASSGAGLGLAIVKTIVDHYGGHIALESKPSVGTTITIQFPKQRS